MTETGQTLIAAMALVEEISTALGTTSYLWGGCTLDVYRGRILREHHDLDYLTQDLADLLPQFVAQFERRGYITRRLINGDLSIRGCGIPIHLGNIRVADQVTWTHNGEQGSLRFPGQWLCPQSVRFCGIGVHVVAPELEYVLKSQPYLLNPNWQPRPQDIAARDWLEVELERRGVAVAGLPEVVESSVWNGV